MPTTRTQVSRRYQPLNATIRKAHRILTLTYIRMHLRDRYFRRYENLAYFLVALALLPLLCYGVFQLYPAGAAPIKSLWLAIYTPAARYSCSRSLTVVDYLSVVALFQTIAATLTGTLPGVDSSYRSRFAPELQYFSQKTSSIMTAALLLLNSFVCSALGAGILSRNPHRVTLGEFELLVCSSATAATLIIPLAAFYKAPMLEEQIDRSSALSALEQVKKAEHIRDSLVVRCAQHSSRHLTRSTRSSISWHRRIVSAVWRWWIADYGERASADHFAKSLLRYCYVPCLLAILFLASSWRTDHSFVSSTICIILIVYATVSGLLVFIYLDRPALVLLSSISHIAMLAFCCYSLGTLFGTFETVTFMVSWPCAWLLAFWRISPRLARAQFVLFARRELFDYYMRFPLGSHIGHTQL